MATFSSLSAYILFLPDNGRPYHLRVREPELLLPYKPMVCVPVVFALVSRCVVACGAVFAPVQAVMLIGLWLVGLGLYKCEEAMDREGRGGE